MGTISLEHSNRLYWLGRYTERFFTTLKALGDLYDKMLDTQHGYTDYLGCFGLADTYADNAAFFRAFRQHTGMTPAQYRKEKSLEKGRI